MSFKLQGASIIIVAPYNDTAHYNSTLAWKVNNAFGDKTNTQFVMVEHPRFGSVVAILATKDIKVN